MGKENKSKENKLFLKNNPYCICAENNCEHCICVENNCEADKYCEDRFNHHCICVENNCEDRFNPDGYICENECPYKNYKEKK